MFNKSRMDLIQARNLTYLAVLAFPEIWKISANWIQIDGGNIFVAAPHLSTSPSKQFMVKVLMMRKRMRMRMKGRDEGRRVKRLLQETASKVGRGRRRSLSLLRLLLRLLCWLHLSNHTHKTTSK
jgi:hypothetical protein